MSHDEHLTPNITGRSQPVFNLAQTSLPRVLQGILEASQEGILLLDEHNEALVMNERFIEFWSLPPALTVYGSGAKRRAWMSTLVKDPAELQRLHNLMLVYPKQSVSGDIVLTTGRVISGLSHPITDDSGAFLGQLIVYRDRTDVNRAVAQSHFFEHHDATTGLLNRSAMFHAIEHVVTKGTPFALVAINISRLQRFTAEYGHLFVDQMLTSCASTLLDIAGTTSPVSRHADDEFLLLLEHRGEQEVEDIATRVVHELSKQIEILGVPVSPAATAGISMYPADGHNANDLVSAARIALEQARLVHPGEVSRYSAEFGSLDEERRELTLQLAHAADGSGLQLLYQPIYDLRMRALASCEVLLRWHSRVLGVVSPAVFLPHAEESGLIIPIGEWVLRRACAQAAAWSAEPYGAIPISVNVSAKQFADVNFADTVQQILAETGCSPFLLNLELTETTLVENLTQVSRTLEKIRALGVKIYIDDFGTGYSNLSYLKHFRVDALKIDQSFTQGIGHSNQDDALMQAAISMAQALGLTAIAEGVETPEQFDFLSASGCDQVQGYFLNRPMNVAQFTELLAENDSRLSTGDAP